MENTRNKLIKLLGEAHRKSTEEACFNDATYAKQLRIEADHLIANGVIVPPCKIGDDIWWIDAETDTVQCETNGVNGFLVKKDEILIVDKAGESAHIGTQYCYLSKEEAEKALEE